MIRTRTKTKPTTAAQRNLILKLKTIPARLTAMVKK